MSIENGCNYYFDCESCTNNDCLVVKQRTEIEQLTKKLKDLDWYKMWHKKFKKEIDDLTLELETYRPTKLSGNGQCKCSICGHVSWTDWFSRYKGKTLCDDCLKEIISTEEDRERELQKQVDELTDKLGKVLSGIKADEFLAARGVEQAVKDTAKKFAERAKEEAFCVFMGEPIIRASKIDEICKEMVEETNENTCKV